MTNALKRDLLSYAEESRALFLSWPRPVLVFDIYEWLAPLVDSWVRTELLSGGFLESGCCVLLFSGRESLLRTDTRWSEWQHQMTVVELEPFDREITDGYLADLNVGPERFETLYELTGGLPLFLALAAHIKDSDQAVSCLAERVLEKVPSESRDDFLMASLLDSFDAENLGRLSSGRTSDELSALIALLSQATFTVARDGRRAFLDSVRKVLRRALQLKFGRQRVQEPETDMER